MKKAILAITFMTFLISFNYSSFATDSNIEKETNLLPNQEGTKTVVTLPAGTSIPIETSSILNSANLVTGQRVNLRVSYDVKVGRKVVIAGGSTVQGRVESAAKARRLGRPGEIIIKAVSVQAVDGTIITLNSEKVSKKGKSKKGLVWTLTIVGFLLFAWAFIGLFSPLFLLIKGKDAAIAAGTSLNASTYSSSDIEVK